MNYDDVFFQDAWNAQSFPIKFYESKKRHLIIISCQEFETGMLLNDEVFDYLNSINGTLNVILGGSELELVYKKYTNLPPSTVHLWPTFLANWIFRSFCWNNPLYILTNPIPVPTKPYIFLNGVPKQHRLDMMNELYNRNLLDENLVTWHNLPPELPEHVVAASDWKPKKLVLNLPINTIFNQTILPSIFNDTFVSLTGETTISTIFFTEKTWLPILLRRPVLSLAAPGFYKKLYEYGFKLYDEIFDYSFDAEIDEKKRLTMLIDNIQRMQHANLAELQTIITPKLIYNYNNLIKIIFDKSLVPDILWKTFNNSADHPLPFVNDVMRDIVNNNPPMDKLLIL